MKITNPTNTEILKLIIVLYVTLKQKKKTLLCEDMTQNLKGNIKMRGDI